jgi:hypothetical protein
MQSPLDEKYVTSVENTQLMSDYTDFMAGKLLCFIHELAQGDRYATMNRLKSLITEDVISVNQKYARQYYIQNTVNFVFFSNLLDAIKVVKNDRRLFVVYNDKEPKESGYYSRVVQAFDEHYFSIYHYLKTRDLAGFNAHAKPPETEGKKQLKEHSLNELALYLLNLSNGEDGEHGENPLSRKGVVVSDLLAYVETNGPSTLRNKVSFKSIASWLVENGYTYKDYDVTTSAGKRLRKRVYFKKTEKIGKKDFQEILAG